MIFNLADGRRVSIPRSNVAYIEMLPATNRSTTGKVVPLKPETTGKWDLVVTYKQTATSAAGVPNSTGMTLHYDSEYLAEIALFSIDTYINKNTIDFEEMS